MNGTSRGRRRTLQVTFGFMLALVAMFAAGSAGAQGQPPSGHLLKVKEPRCVPGECICRGRADVRARLNENGPTPSDLRRGVRCIAADFDGNGAVDYALPGAEGLATVILSTRGSGFLRAITLDAGGIIHLYPPRATPGPDGEPATKLPGLFVSSVGQSHVAFLWDGQRFARTLVRARAR